MGETLDAVRAEENLREVAATQRSDQPIEDDQVGALWQNWLVACSEHACSRSIDGVTTQSEEDPIKCKTTARSSFSAPFRLLLLQPRRHFSRRSEINELER